MTAKGFGRMALATGASRGIGHTEAFGLADTGGDVVLNDMSQKGELEAVRR